ncbi:hypothetical protein P3T16_000242 [Paraburkholderia sp. GAS42]
MPAMAGVIPRHQVVVVIRQNPLLAGFFSPFDFQLGLPLVCPMFTYTYVVIVNKHGLHLWTTKDFPAKSMHCVNDNHADLTGVFAGNGG